MAVPRRRVITERDVRRAAERGETTLDTSGSVVTPSARDAAARARIALLAKTDSATGSRPPSAPPTAGGTTATERRPPAVTQGSTGRTVAVGADHGGVRLKEAVAARLRELGHTVLDVGTMTSDPVDYPDYARAVAAEVAAGRAELGIMVDGAGIGSCMTANKVRGVRAAMCHDVTTAVNAREHNNANVLTLGGGLLGERLALAVVETFLATPFGGGRHAGRVAKIDALDRQAEAAR